MAKYPQILAGQRITSTMLRDMLPEVIVKPSTTARASTTTLANDPDLQMTLSANAMYFVEFEILAAATNTADFKTEWTVPSGSTGLKAVLGPSSSASTQSTADPTTVRMGCHQFGTDIVYAGVRDDNSLAFYCREWGVVTTSSTGGTLALAWAQGTSNATATQVFGGSVMRVRRVA